MKIILIIFSILLLVNFVFAQNKTHEFKGILATENNAVIAGANLYFDGKKKMTVVTDINGEFKTNLPAGDYQIIVNDILSKSFRAFIKIRDEGANPNNVTFRIRTNKNPCGLDENETCPKPISLPKPPYPPAARAANITGSVLVKVNLDTNGKISSVEAINGHPLLQNASLEAARKSVFEKNQDTTGRELYLEYIFINGKKENESEKFQNMFRIQIENNWVLVEGASH